MTGEHLCSCGKPIKTKEAKRCQSCRTIPYYKMADRFFEEGKKRYKMRGMVQYQERRPEE